MAKNEEMANVSQALLGANDKGKVSYQVNGEDVNLSFQIVRNFLTRGNAALTDAEVVQFITLCRANKLNPFIGEAYLVKFQARDGQRQEGAQMIIAKDAFMKRAEGTDLYKGYQAGVILLRDNKVVEVEGSFFLPGDTLVGGWAKVFRKDRDYPIVARVRLQEYNKGKSTWAAMPGTMIRKVAIAQAFREAFPLSLGGMYIAEEQQPDEQAQPEEANRVKPVFTEEPKQVEAPKAVEEEKVEEKAEEQPEPVKAPEAEPVPVKAGQDAHLLAAVPKEEKLPWEDEGKKDDEKLFEL